MSASAAPNRRKSVIARSVDTKRLIRVSSADTEMFQAFAPGSGLEWRQFTFGRLLLFAFSAYEARILESYRAAGYGDVRQVHFSVTRHIDATTGTRIGDLAARAGITKAAMGQLVVDCARLDLVDVSSDPADGRVKIVSLSARGHKLMAQTRRASKRIEADFAKLLGPESFAALRNGLIDLREKMSARAAKRRTP